MEEKSISKMTRNIFYLGEIDNEGVVINASRNKREEKDYVYRNGTKYTGEWMNNMKDGVGTFTWKDGTQYIGEWRQDRA